MSMDEGFTSHELLPFLLGFRSSGGSSSGSSGSSGSCGCLPTRERHHCLIAVFLVLVVVVLRNTLQERDINIRDLQDF